MRQWMYLTSVLMLVFLGIWVAGCAPSARKHSKPTPQPSKAESQTVALKVDGLDGQSQARITAEMQKLGQVQNVQVDQKNGLVRVTFKTAQKVLNQQVMQAVQQAGYAPRQILESPLELSQLEKTMPTHK